MNRQVMGVCALVAVVSAVVLPLAGGSASSKPRTAELRFVIWDLPHGHEALVQQGKRVGWLLSGDQTTYPKGAYIAVDAAVLEGGHIFMGSAATDRHNIAPNVAVLGGTGKYAGVTGTGRLNFSGSTNRLRFKLTFPE
jgi:hypothetical protein